MNSEDFLTDEGRKLIHEMTKEDEESVRKMWEGELDRRIAAGGRWIPTSERLPPEHGYVLAWDGKRIELATLCNFRGRLELFDGEARLVKATHWMPLPEPPK